ncbi:MULTISPECIES: DUF7146 domain-containing protein [Cysteiniphilum]|uniref:Toprim domain-containing protein n=1 Tax=Cysteiniphilum litorale TaxID=2056700 RepID=A0A8J2Z2K0_9GAMM|nr:MULTISPECIES: toprim domain-containing protein [Cysteiniphilum]GGF91183.1 hypothetical protein GCM10010995_05590 [Cysteiniphilum litorale]
MSYKDRKLICLEISKNPIDFYKKYLGDKYYIDGNTARWGDKGSFSVYIAGKDKGRAADLANNEKGFDPVHFLTKNIRGPKLGYKDALDVAWNHAGLGDEVPINKQIKDRIKTAKELSLENIGLSVKQKVEIANRIWSYTSDYDHHESKTVKFLNKGNYKSSGLLVRDLPSYQNDGKTKNKPGGVVIPCYNTEYKLLGTHTYYLDDDGQSVAYKRKASDRGLYKQTHGDFISDNTLGIIKDFDHDNKKVQFICSEDLKTALAVHTSIDYENPYVTSSFGRANLKNAIDHIIALSDRGYDVEPIILLRQSFPSKQEDKVSIPKTMLDILAQFKAQLPDEIIKKTKIHQPNLFAYLEEQHPRYNVLRRYGNDWNDVYSYKQQDFKKRFAEQEKSLDQIIDFYKQDLPYEPSSLVQNEKYDVDSIVKALIDNSEDTYREIFFNRGEPKNKGASLNRELRYDGGLIVTLHGKNRGSWFSHTEQRGGGPLQAIEYEEGSKSYKETIERAIEILGMSKDAFISSDMSNKDMEHREKLRKEREEKRRQEDLEQKKYLMLKAQSLYNASTDMTKENLAYVYSNNRGLNPAGYNDVRFIDVGAKWYDYEEQEDGSFKAVEQTNRGPALMLVAKNENGDITAVQRTFLTKDGKKNNNLYLVKRTDGVLNGSAHILQKGESKRVIIGEGYETAGSLANAFPNDTVLVSMGINNMSNLLNVIKNIPTINHVIFAKDNDGEDLKKPNAFSNAVNTYHQAGYNIEILEPLMLESIIKKVDEHNQHLLEGEKAKKPKTDWNDVHQEFGLDGLKNALADEKCNLNIQSFLDVDEPLAVNQETLMNWIVKNKLEDGQSNNSVQKDNEFGANQQSMTLNKAAAELRKIINKLMTDQGGNSQTAMESNNQNNDQNVDKTQNNKNTIVNDDEYRLSTFIDRLYSRYSPNKSYNSSSKLNIMLFAASNQIYQTGVYLIGDAIDKHKNHSDISERQLSLVQSLDSNYYWNTMYDLFESLDDQSLKLSSINDIMSSFSNDKSVDIEFVKFINEMEEKMSEVLSEIDPAQSLWSNNSNSIIEAIQSDMRFLSVNLKDENLNNVKVNYIEVQKHNFNASDAKYHLYLKELDIALNKKLDNCTINVSYDENGVNKRPQINIVGTKDDDNYENIEAIISETANELWYQYVLASKDEEKNQDSLFLSNRISARYFEIVKECEVVMGAIDRSENPKYLKSQLASKLNCFKHYARHMASDNSVSSDKLPDIDQQIKLLKELSFQVKNIDILNNIDTSNSAENIASALSSKLKSNSDMIVNTEINQLVNFIRMDDFFEKYANKQFDRKYYDVMKSFVDTKDICGIEIHSINYNALFNELDKLYKSMQSSPNNSDSVNNLEAGGFKFNDYPGGVDIENDHVSKKNVDQAIKII